jgi:hypothetical protein
MLFIEKFDPVFYTVTNYKVVLILKYKGQKYLKFQLRKIFRIPTNLKIFIEI